MKCQQQLSQNQPSDPVTTASLQTSRTDTPCVCNNCFMFILFEYFLLFLFKPACFLRYMMSFYKRYRSPFITNSTIRQDLRGMKGRILTSSNSHILT